jgi:hypothetical protein
MFGLSTPFRPMIFFDRILGVDRRGLWRRVARVRVYACVRLGACACMCAGVDVPPLFPYHPGRIDS